MGHGEPRREVQPVSDDLDVAGRLSRSGPVQRGVELAERGDSRREPAPAAQGGGQGVVIPGGEVVVDHLMRSKWWNSDSANLCGGAMALSQPLLASSGGELQDRSIGRFIGVHLQDGGAAFRELDADLHFMEGRNQGCPLGTELDPDLLFKPRTIHGSFLHAARRPEEPKRYPPGRGTPSLIERPLISKQSSVRESDDAPRLAA